VPDECDPDANHNGIPDECEPPVLTGAVSRKWHGGSGAWDIDVGAGDIESRSLQLATTASPNQLTIIATFAIDVAVLGGVAAVQTDVGTVTSITQPHARVVEIDMTDLPYNGQVNLGFNDGVNGIVDATYPTDPATASNSTLCVRIIVGDYDNLGRTNYLDFRKIMADGYLGRAVASVAHAQADFDCSGTPSFLDFARVKNAGLINQTAPECATPIGP
jgi:hypothetical protein